MPAMPLPASTAILSGLTLRDVDEGEAVVDVVVGHVALDDLALARRRGELAASTMIANVVAAGLGADGDGLLAAHLQAVVLPGLCEAVIMTPAG